MGKTIVIYNSQTGFTKKYAEWISDALKCGIAEVSKVKIADLSEYDNIIFGSWACAGGISKLGWFKSNILKLKNKRLAVFCVGASPNENPEIKIAFDRIFGTAEFKNVAVFYCQGGFNYEKMSAGNKLLMKMFISALKSKKDKTEQDNKMIEMISNSYDISDKKFTEPIIKWANE